MKLGLSVQLAGTMAKEAREWCMENGSAATSVPSIIDNRDEVVLRYINYMFRGGGGVGSNWW